MRVSSCNCHYPLVCCSKSSQWGDAQNVSSGPAPVSIASVEEKPSDQKVVIKQNSGDDGRDEIHLKSSIKKPRKPNSDRVGKGNVKWTDLVGKELVEILEFETIESEEPEDYTDGNMACICVIQ